AASARRLAARRSDGDGRCPFRPARARGGHRSRRRLRRVDGRTSREQGRRSMTTFGVVAAIVFGFLALEAGHPAPHRTPPPAGCAAPPGDVYQAMRFAFPAAFAAMIAEGIWRGAPPTALFVSGTMLFIAAKALKWWAILTLGRFWTFRVIVVPGTTLVARGPY